MSAALDPVTCTRCKRKVAADDPDRPQSISSRAFAPADPRPTMPSGAPIWWTTEADYKDDFEAETQVHALLCASCVSKLRTWIYQAGASGSVAS